MTGWEYMHSTGLGGMLLSILTAAALILLLIFGAIMFRCFITRGNNQAPPEGPLDILRKRYARGEITAEEFEHMKHFLES